MEEAIKISRNKIISDGMLGMVLFLCVEVMLFAGFISAYVINRTAAVRWPPYGQPRLPVEATFINSLVLLASGITIYLFSRNFRKTRDPLFLNVTLFLGSVFLAVQGTEWARLIGFGLTTSSSLYGAFFYTLIGAHAFHALAGLILLLYVHTSTWKRLPEETIHTRVSVCSLYWYFVVGIWPVLYIFVYLF